MIIKRTATVRDLRKEFDETFLKKVQTLIDRSQERYNVQIKDCIIENNKIEISSVKDKLTINLTDEIATSKAGNEIDVLFYSILLLANAFDYVSKSSSNLDDSKEDTPRRLLIKNENNSKGLLKTVYKAKKKKADKLCKLAFNTYKRDVLGKKNCPIKFEEFEEQIYKGNETYYVRLTVNRQMRVESGKILTILKHAMEMTQISKKNRLIVTDIIGEPSLEHMFILQLTINQIQDICKNNKLLANKLIDIVLNQHKIEIVKSLCKHVIKASKDITQRINEQVIFDIIKSYIEYKHQFVRTIDDLTINSINLSKADNEDD